MQVESCYLYTFQTDHCKETLKKSCESIYALTSVQAESRANHIKPKLAAALTLLPPYLIIPYTELPESHNPTLLGLTEDLQSNLIVWQAAL